MASMTAARLAAWMDESKAERTVEKRDVLKVETTVEWRESSTEDLKDWMWEE